MDYSQTLLLIQERGEHILFQDVQFLITDSHRYMRVDGEWIEDVVPGGPVKKFGRGGEYYVWIRMEE
jgi:hypothetical protein